MQSNTRDIVAYGGARGGRSANATLNAAGALALGGSVVVCGDKAKERLMAELEKIGIKTTAEPMKENDWILSLKKETA